MPNPPTRSVYLPDYGISVQVPAAYTEAQVADAVARNKAMLEKDPAVRQFRYERFVNRPDPAWNQAIRKYQQDYFSNPDDDNIPNSLLQQVRTLPGGYRRLEKLNQLNPGLSEVGKAAILQRARATHGDGPFNPRKNLQYLLGSLTDAAGNPTPISEEQARQKGIGPALKAVQQATQNYTTQDQAALARHYAAQRAINSANQHRDSGRIVQQAQQKLLPPEQLNALTAKASNA